MVHPVDVHGIGVFGLGVVGPGRRIEMEIPAVSLHGVECLHFLHLA